MPKDPKEREAVEKKYFHMEQWEKEASAETIELKRVADYSGLSLSEIFSMPMGAYGILRKEAWLSSMGSTEGGREVLQRLYELKQDKADEQGLGKLEQVL